MDIALYVIQNSGAPQLVDIPITRVLHRHDTFCAGKDELCLEWRFFPNASHVEQHENRNQSAFVCEERTGRSRCRNRRRRASGKWLRRSWQNRDRRNTAAVSRGEMRPCFASPRQRKFWRRTSGCSTTNSAVFPDSEVPGGSGNPAYTAALSVLDADMAQYIHDNTDDEFTHQNFLNAYLASKGAIR